MIEHELRRQVVREMHLRRWPQVRAPSRIIQLVRIVEPCDREVERTQIRNLLGNDDPGSDQERHIFGTLEGGINLAWESHSEASTLTLFLPGTENGAITVTPDDWRMDRLGLVRMAPGKIIRATKLHILPDESEATKGLEQLQFDDLELVSCRIGGHDGQPGARIWSDFRIHSDGFGRVIIAANGLSPSDLGRLVQRFQELGNYRNLALLGLPVARQGWQELDNLEDQLDCLTSKVADAQISDDVLLEEVTRISIRLISRASSDDFRMDATEAYASIVSDRLSDLRDAPCAGYQSLTDFTQRRFLPAIRTYASHRQRMQKLALRTEQFIGLFRTRIETRIENQNGLLLASMDRNSRRQLRLQQLVEGLSFVALSYYALGLLGHLAEGIELLAPRLNAHVTVAVVTPALIGGRGCSFTASEQISLENEIFNIRGTEPHVRASF